MGGIVILEEWTTKEVCEESKVKLIELCKPNGFSWCQIHLTHDSLVPIARPALLRLVIGMSIDVACAVKVSVPEVIGLLLYNLFIPVFYVL